MIYRTCDTLPAKNFFKIIEKGDYNYLLKYPILRRLVFADLSEIWEKINHEFSKLDNNSESAGKFNSYKEIHQLIATYEIVNAEIFYLQFKYKKEYIDDLKMLGYDVKIKNNCIDLASLKECTQMARAIINDIEELKKEIEPSKDKSETKNVFENIIAWLVEGFGQVNEQMTVSQYIALKNRLNKKITRENGNNRRK